LECTISGAASLLRDRGLSEDTCKLAYFNEHGLVRKNL
jgi:hypothetical protein